MYFDYAVALAAWMAVGLVLTAVGASFAICPLPSPCYCISNKIINCAFLFLDSLPYFLHFNFVWPELNLSENFITLLPPDGFHGVKSQVVRLNRNYIQTISSNAFRGSRGLLELDLSHNSLKNLTSGAFSHLPEMRILRIQYNQLKELDNQVFLNIPYLHVLDLQGNEFLQVPSNAMRYLPNLKRLVLRNNRIQHVHSYAFEQMSLEYIDLGENKSPVRIHADAFCGLEPRIVSSEPGVVDWTGLNTLLLDHNGLKYFSPCAVKSIWTLAFVDISGNPLRCDCTTLSLPHISSRASFPGAQCATPSSFAGRYLPDVEHSEYRDACFANYYDDSEGGTSIGIAGGGSGGGGSNRLNSNNDSSDICWQSCVSRPSSLSYSTVAPSSNRQGWSVAWLAVITTGFILGRNALLS